MSLLNTILDIVFPTSCISCGKGGSELCVECLSGSKIAERECAEWIFPLYDYRDKNIKKAIWLLKYSGKRRLAPVFAQTLYGRILEELSDMSQLENFRKPLLIPIPLSPKRQRERGFNQALLICKKLIELDKADKNFELKKNILIKPKESVHQAHIEERSKRLKNIIGSFAIQENKQNKKDIQGRNIILIDDVTTTGATLNEAKKVLTEAGAKKIIAFTVAH